MSDELPSDDLIERTKRQIRGLVNEIAQFSKSEMSAEEFYGEFLPRVVTALAAVGGVVWALEESGRIGLKYQVNLQASQLPQKSQEDQIRHGRLLQRVMSTRETIIVPPQSGFGEEEQGANPTDYLLVLGPLRTELETVGVVEIFQRPDTAPATQRGYQRFLEQMCELAADFLKSRQLRHFSDRQVLWTQLEEFTRLVHASLNPRETAYTIANEGRRLIECDRVSVAIPKGRHCVIEAISGQDQFNKRSNTVRLLNKLASVVVAAGEPVWYTGDTSDMAPQVEDAIQEYVDESHSKTVAVLPLRRPGPSEAEKESPDDPQEVPPAVGALIVEQIEDSRVAASLYQRVDVVCRHSSAAMANAMEHENLFLMPVWRALGKSRWLIEVRNLPKVLLALGAVAVLLLVLVLWPADLKMVSKGTLEPVLRRDVFPGIEATVQSVEVKHGTPVEKDQVLVRMRDPMLLSRLAEVKGNYLATDAAIKAIDNRLSNARLNLTLAEQLQIRGERLKLSAENNSYKAQLAVLTEQVNQLTVRSPIRGEVTSWDIDLKIQDRRVRPDTLLVKVADTEGPFQLELQVPEEQMGHIEAAQHERIELLRGKLAEAYRKSAKAQPFRDDVRRKLIVELRAAPRKIEPAPQGKTEPAEPKTDAAPTPGGDAPSTSSATSTSDAPEAQSEAAPAKDETPPEPKSEPKSEPKPESKPEPTATAAPPASAETGSPGPSAAEESLDPELKRQVDAQFPQRLDEEIEKLLAGMTRDQLSAKLLELTDEDFPWGLPVDSNVATEPGASFRGHISEIGRYAEVHGEEGNTVLVKVAIDRDDIAPKDLRQGTSVSAKVVCGRTSLGYSLFHSVFAWVRKMSFRWLY